MSEEKPAAEGEAAEGGKKGGKKKLIIIVGVVLLVVGIAVPMLLLGGGEEKVEEGAEHAEEEPTKNYLTAELPTFIVNLSESSSFLKVTMLVEYDPEAIAKAEAKLGAKGAKGGGGGGGHGGGGGGEPKPGGLPPVMGAREPMIKDAIIRVLSSKKVDEVLTVEGKERLKEELIEAINEALALEDPPIVGVYFTEFIIQ
jgi:flagellar FliL protein